MTDSNAKSLSLRDIHRLMKTSKVGKLVPVESWQSLMTDIYGVLEERSPGLILIHGPQGSGKSTFLRQLAYSIAADDKFHVIRGTIAEPILEPGWLLNFLDDAVAGPSDRALMPREVVSRVADLAFENQGVVIILDDVDLIQKSSLEADLQTFLALVQTSGRFIYVIAACDSALLSSLDTRSFPLDLAVLKKPLPQLTVTETTQIINERVEQAGVDKATINSLIKGVIVSTAETVGLQLRSMIEMLENESGDSTKESFPSVLASSQEPKQAVTQRGLVTRIKKQKKSMEPRKAYSDFLKPQKLKKV